MFVRLNRIALTPENCWKIQRLTEMRNGFKLYGRRRSLKDPLFACASVMDCWSCVNSTSMLYSFPLKRIIFFYLIDLVSLVILITDKFTEFKNMVAIDFFKNGLCQNFYLSQFNQVNLHCLDD